MASIIRAVTNCRVTAYPRKNFPLIDRIDVLYIGLYVLYVCTHIVIDTGWRKFSERFIGRRTLLGICFQSGHLFYTVCFYSNGKNVPLKDASKTCMYVCLVYFITSVWWCSEWKLYVALKLISRGLCFDMCFYISVGYYFIYDYVWKHTQVTLQFIWIF